jgi:hypothetical protein
MPLLHFLSALLEEGRFGKTRIAKGGVHHHFGQKPAGAPEKNELFSILTMKEKKAMGSELYLRGRRHCMHS